MKTKRRICQHTRAYVSIRQHTSAYVSMLFLMKTKSLHSSEATSSCFSSARRIVAGIDTFTYTVSPSASSCIRQHTSAYGRIRPHSSRHRHFHIHRQPQRLLLHTSAYVSIRQHTSAYVSIRQPKRLLLPRRSLHTSAYVSIRQHTSAFVGIRRHASAYVSVRQHTSAPPRPTPLPGAGASVFVLCTSQYLYFVKVLCVSICTFVLVKQVN
jgi:hypothetical protein